MALLFVHGKCQHYYESGQASEVLSQMVQAQRDLNTAISELRYLQDDYDDWLLRIEVMPYEAVDRQLDSLERSADLNFTGIDSDDLGSVERFLEEARGVQLPLGYGRD